jgi:hypothetical protein
VAELSAKYYSCNRLAVLYSVNVLEHRTRRTPELAGTVDKDLLQHPSQFLTNLYNIDGGIFMAKLVSIAEKRDIPVSRVINTLSKFVPDFTEFLTSSAGL